MSHLKAGTRVELTRQLTEADHACTGLILPIGCRGVLIDTDGYIAFRPTSNDNTFDDWGCYLSSDDYRKEETIQTIQINLGLCWNQGGESGEFGNELGRFLIEHKFPYCSITFENYIDSWQADDGTIYRDNCIAAKIVPAASQCFPIGAIEEKVDSLRIILKQDAVSFTTISGRGAIYSDVYYGPVKPNDGYIFDPKRFHYVN